MTDPRDDESCPPGWRHSDGQFLRRSDFAATREEMEATYAADCAPAVAQRMADIENWLRSPGGHEFAEGLADYPPSRVGQAIWTELARRFPTGTEPPK